MASAAPERRARHAKLGAVALLVLGAFILCFSVGSFAYCPAMPSFDLCRVAPTCSAVHIDRTDNSGPAWRCRSRFAD